MNEEDLVENHDDEEWMDWVAAYDQVSAEVRNVIKERRPFVIIWADEEEETVSSTGLFRPGDEDRFLMALLQRRMMPFGGGLPCGPRPE